MKIENLIYIYGLICLSMIGFNCFCIVMFKHHDFLLQHRSKKLTRSIQQQMIRLENNEKITKKHQRLILKKCSKVQHLLAFDETLSMLEQHETKVTEYHRQMQPIYVALAMKYVEKEDMQVACFAYVLAKHRIGYLQEMNPLSEIFLTILKKESLYCKQNVMRFFYAKGNVSDILQAIDVINQQNTFYHAKILTDGLMTFVGDHQQLMDAIWKQHRKWKWEVQLACLNYIRFQSGCYQAAFYELLQDKKQHRELHFSAIRYLGKYPYAPAKSQLIQFVEEMEPTRWEYAAFSATTLANYPGEDTIQALKKACSSSSWYVRNNAAMSLGRLGLQYRDLLDVIQGDDRYAREIILYHFNDYRVKGEEYA